MSKNNMISSGCHDFDMMRQMVQKRPTTGENSRNRSLTLYMWISALQQQGADLTGFFDMDNRYYELESLVNEGDKDGSLEMNKWVDRAYKMIEEVQRSLHDDGPLFTPCEGVDTEAEEEEPRENWPQFQNNISNTGSSNAPGAQRGKAEWKFPVSLGWYCRPLIEGNRIYVTSPGMRTTCFCLDSATGDVIWKSGQNHPLFGIYKYPAMMSTPLSVDDTIVLREVNSHGGNEGQARNLVYLDKKTGKEVSKSYAGHIDYRTQYAPAATMGDYMVYPFGIHDIYSSPAVCQNLNQLVCADKYNKQKKWEMNIGDIDILAEPVLTETTVFQGTEDNYLYAVELETGDMKWKFRAGASVNTRVTIDNGVLYFGANDGVCYALDEETGKLIWKIKLEEADETSRKQFSTIEWEDDSLYLGSSNSLFYCLNRHDGTVRWQRKTPDWIRSKPVILEGKIMAACLDGRVLCFDSFGELLWEMKFSDHPILADLTGDGKQFYVSNGNLEFFCLDSSGVILWEKTLLESFTDSKGKRILSDILSGGTYYQSKPTAAEDKVFFGTHAGLLYAVDYATGKEIWKFEIGGSISVGAAFYEGKIYAGQQGGERFFYCLNAQDGSLIWKKALPGGWVWGSACVDDGMVYIPTVDGHAVCMEAETGNIVWMYPTAKSVPAEPAVEGNLVYFGSWSQTLYAFNKKTGDIVWKQSGISLDSGTLIAYKGKVYVPHHHNIFMAMDAQTGEVLCEGNLDAEAKGEFSDFNASPCFKDNRAYFSARVGRGLHGVPLYTKLYCVNPETADIHWTFPDGGGISAPAASRNRLYIASGSLPYLHCLNPETGESYWTYHMGNRMEESTLCLYGNFLYALASDGYLHAIK